MDQSRPPTFLDLLGWFTYASIIGLGLQRELFLSAFRAHERRREENVSDLGAYRSRREERRTRDSREAAA